jgi:hypothetical protein
MIVDEIEVGRVPGELILNWSCIMTSRPSKIEIDAGKTSGSGRHARDFMAASGPKAFFFVYCRSWGGDCERHFEENLKV